MPSFRIVREDSTGANRAKRTELSKKRSGLNHVITSLDSSHSAVAVHCGDAANSPYVFLPASVNPLDGEQHFDSLEKGRQIRLLGCVGLWFISGATRKDAHPMPLLVSAEPGLMGRFACGPLSGFAPRASFRILARSGRSRVEEKGPGSRGGLPGRLRGYS